MITMTLADGTEVRFSGMNGTNYIVPDKKEMDTSVFTEDNLVSGTFTDEDGNTEEFANLRLIQQQKQKNGDYYVCFWQKTAEELKEETIKKYIEQLEANQDYIAMMADIELDEDEAETEESEDE